MLISGRKISVFILLALLVLPTACAKRSNARLKRGGKVAARPVPRISPTAPGGTKRTQIPVVDSNPSTEPVREYLGYVTLDNKLEYALAEQGFDPSKNCFQYVYSNYVESIEISKGACVGNQLAAWSNVVTTLYFFSPDEHPIFDIYHASDSNVKLGGLIEDLSAPGNAYIYDLCTGDFMNNEETGKAGCSFTFDGKGVITDLYLQSQL